MAEFLSGIPKWQQVAVNKLLKSDKFNETDIDELKVLCQQEAQNEFPDIDYSIPTIPFDTHNEKIIHLSSISEIKGVNKLSPKYTLNFGKSNMAVVYGDNGTGKSGYVRLLKHVCGARDCMRGV